VEGFVPVTVAIIDGRPFTCAVTELAIARTYDFEVVFSGGSAEELEKSGVEADLVVLDLLAIPGGTALDTVRRLAQTKRVLVTAPVEHVPSMIEAIRVGARGCLTGYKDEYEIVNALRVVAQEAIYFSAESSEYLHDRLAAADPAPRNRTTTVRRRRFRAGSCRVSALRSGRAPGRGLWSADRPARAGQRARRR
jgi:DNA-binding NarL/FixJ family response regulator